MADTLVLHNKSFRLWCESYETFKNTGLGNSSVRLLMIVSVTSDHRYIARIDCGRLLVTEFTDPHELFVEISLPHDFEVRRANWDASAVWSERFLAVEGSSKVLIVSIESDGTHHIETLGPFIGLRKCRWLSRAEKPAVAVQTVLGLYAHGSIVARPKQPPAYFPALGAWLLLCRNQHRDLISVVDSIRWVDSWELPGKNAFCLCTHYSQPIYSYYDEVQGTLVVASLTKLLARRRSSVVRQTSWIRGPGMGYLLCVEGTAVLLRTTDLQIAHQIPDTWSGEIWSMTEDNYGYEIAAVKALKLTDGNTRVSVSPDCEHYALISGSTVTVYNAPFTLMTVVQHPGAVLQIDWHGYDTFTTLGEEFVGLHRPSKTNPLAVRIVRPKGVAYGRGRLIAWSIDELVYNDIEPLHDVTTAPTFMPA